MAKPKQTRQREPLLTPVEVAARLNVSVHTITTWRSRDPHRLPFVRLSTHCVRYRPEVIDAYIAERSVGST